MADGSWKSWYIDGECRVKSDILTVIEGLL